MKIKHKLLLQAILLSTLPALLIALLITIHANQSSYSALEKTAKGQLTSLREIKKTQITDYLEQFNAQVDLMAKNITVISAAQALVANFKSSATPTPDKKALISYYQQEFSNKYAQMHTHNEINVAQQISQLDVLGEFYQSQYIAKNPFPLGQKDKLFEAGNSAYDQTHALYHNMFRDVITAYGYYDIFIVDAQTGHVVYSVFKEVDYATSLLNGPYKESGLATAFKKSLSLKEGEKSSVVDFSPYLPSYNMHAAFIGAPIKNAQGGIDSVIIFQMPVDAINQIMTNNQRWQDVGLGLSGETYLVGEDQLLRSESRFLIENKPAYLQALEDSNTQPFLEDISKHGTALGLQYVKTPGVKNALAGQTGFALFPDYRNVEVLSSYTFIDFGGKRWALIAEMDADEVFASAIAVVDEIKTYSIISLLVIALVSALIGLYSSRALVKPINKLVETITDISEGDGDLTVQLELAKRNDEIGDVGKAFNLFVRKIRTIISEIDTHAVQLASSSEELEAVTNETNNIVLLQRDKTNVTQQTVSEFNGSIVDIADNSLHTAALTEKASTHSIKGAELSKEAQSAINSLVESVDSASQELQGLNSHVEDIAGILSVIEGISEQINLLALNAAIEAARAGESGRGFSVVADEVRSLASKTQGSTVEIQNKINGLKASSLKSVNAMGVASTQALKGIELVKQTSANLTLVAELVADVSSKNTNNAAVAKQQSISMNEVHQNIIDIASYTNTTSSASLQTSQASSELSRLAVNMSNLVRQFKY